MYVADKVTLRHFDGPDLTAMAFDDNIFFRTGNVSQRRGAKYYRYGRASVDGKNLHSEPCVSLSTPIYFAAINVKGRVFAGDVESAILSLPYVEDVYVVPISQVGSSEKKRAAIIQPTQEMTPAVNITVSSLRHDLQQAGLEEYQMPNAFRITAPSTPLPV